jgi:hypothetical protein
MIIISLSRLNQNKPIGHNHDNAAKLDAGTHVFTFEFLLPDNLPTSYDGANQCCSVRYFVKVCNKLFSFKQNLISSGTDKTIKSHNVLSQGELHNCT